MTVWNYLGFWSSMVIASVWSTSSQPWATLWSVIWIALALSYAWRIWKDES